MALLIAAAAPGLAWFFGVSEVRAVCLALAGTALATSLGTQHLALLQRRLRLGILGAIRLGALALGGAVAVAVALAGYGVWTLVVQQYVELLALAALAWRVERWRPGWPRRRVGARRLVRFGGYYALSDLMFYVAANVDKVLVGFVLGPRALGLYGQAFNLMRKPVHVVITPLTAVMLPALSRAAPDRQHHTEWLLAFSRFIALLMFPAGVGLMIVAPEAIRVIGGPRWAEAGALLAVLAGVVLVQGFVNAFGFVLASVGRVRRLALASIAIGVALSAGPAAGLYFGHRMGAPLLGTAVGYALTAIFVVFPFYLMLMLRAVGTPLRLWLDQVRGPALASAAMGLIVAGCHLLLAGLPDPLLLAIEVAAGALSYTALAQKEIRRLLSGLSEHQSAASERSL
jgi:PST family polysaccharide transporter